jgi:DNA primase
MKPAESIRLWQRVWEVYARRLRESPAAIDCLQALNIADRQVLEHFHAGYSDGTLPGMLPKAGDLRDALRAKGLLNRAGEEALFGNLVVPVYTAGGAITGFCGVHPGNGSMPKEVLIPATVAGLVRGALAKSQGRLFATNRVIDAFALWQAGFTNVVMVAGGSASLTELQRLVRDNDCREVYLCFSIDKAGKLLGEQIMQALEEDHAVWAASAQWPPGTNGASDFFQRHRTEEFEALLPKPPPASKPADQAPGMAIAETPEGLDACLDGRRYELRAIQKPGPSRLKATVRAVADHGRFVVETVDFYYSRSRRVIMAEAARLFNQTLEIIQEDFSSLTVALENYVQRQAKDGQSHPRTVRPEDEAEGVKLGRAPDLAGEIVRDIGRLGLIGEETNKLLAYLVMTSRKLPEPLALLIVSGSGAGKSHLQDTVLSLCPEEDLVKLTSLTDQALFYRGAESLRHKVLALEEHAGAKGADYAIRNLLSARKLVIETTVKNALTGRLETQVNTVHGPTAVFQTTTSPHTDAETRSRFVLVSVDESAAQTRAILERQRQVHTLAGLRHRQDRDRILRRHHAFQRLLRQVLVINPFEPLLSYPTEHLLVRRDQPKYLQLILAVAFLHQLQRPLRHDQDLGDYVEATLEDVAIANELAHQVFGNSLADLSQPGRDLLVLIENFVRHKAASGADDKETFSRRELREFIHWGDTRLRTHLKELVELEYLATLSGRFGVTYRYRLLSRPSQIAGRFLPGLKSVEQLRTEARLAGVWSHLAPTAHVEKCEVAAAPSQAVPDACERITQTSQPCSGGQVLPPHALSEES